VESRWVRVLVKAGTVITLVFLYAPIVILVLYAFNKGLSRKWPPDLWTTRWFTAAWHDPDLKPALLGSVEAAIGATLIALFLGSCAAFAVHRFRFFGRETVSFILVLPIALPGIVTAIALSSAVDVGNRLTKAARFEEGDLAAEIAFPTEQGLTATESRAAIGPLCESGAVAVCSVVPRATDASSPISAKTGQTDRHVPQLRHLAAISARSSSSLPAPLMPAPSRLRSPGPAAGSLADRVPSSGARE